MNPIQSKLLLSFCALFCTLLSLEIAFVFLLPQPKELEAHSLNRGRFTRPGIHHNQSSEFSVSVKVNQQGFVDSEWKKENTDILVLGDSFVQAAQVQEEEGLGRQMTQFFAQKDQRKNIISIGVPGAGTVTEFELLKEHSPILQPKELLLGFLVDNDIFNNHWDLESKSNKPFYRVQENELKLFWKENLINTSFAWQYSNLFRWGYQRYWRYSEKKRQLSQRNNIPLPFEVYNPNPSKLWKESWIITQRILREMKNYCLKNNILK